MASSDSGDSPSKVATAAMGRGWDVDLRVVGQQWQLSSHTI